MTNAIATVWLKKALQDDIPDYGGEAIDRPLTLACMLAAFRQHASSAKTVRRQIDSVDELTANKWLELLGHLRENERRPNAAALFNDFERFQASLLVKTPGVLEHYRRLASALYHKHPHTPHLSIEIMCALLETVKPTSAITVPLLDQAIFQITKQFKEPTALCSYSDSAASALALALAGVSVTLEVDSAAVGTLCALLAYACDLDLKVRIGDPLKLADNALCSNHPDHKAAIAIVVPPLPTAPVDPKTYSTLRKCAPLANSFEGIAATLAIAHATTYALCLVPDGLLFHTTSEDKDFKDHLLRCGLATIISLPNRVRRTPLPPVSLLLFRLISKSGDEIHLINLRKLCADASEPRLPENFGDLVVAGKNSPGSDTYAVQVTREQVTANYYNLSFDRYLYAQNTQKTQKKGVPTKTAPLSSLAKIYRPQGITTTASAAEACDLKVFEVAIADITESGLISTVDREIINPPKSKVDAAMLKPGDILLAVKGGVGKVGYVDHIPDGMIWVASQSFAIVSQHRGANTLLLSPLVLFRFFSSPLGQEIIHSCKGGAAVPVLQMRDVRELLIPIPSRGSQQNIINKAKEMFRLQMHINEARAHIKRITDAVDDDDL